MSTFGAMPPGKNKKRFEVHFTAGEIKGFEKIRRMYPRMSMKKLMETMLLEYLPIKLKFLNFIKYKSEHPLPPKKMPKPGGVSHKITVINESGSVNQKAFNKFKPKKKK